MQKQKELRNGAILTGFINAVINGTIQYFLLRDKTEIAISVDSITNNEHTVLGEAVVLSITLAMILTLVAYFTIKGPKVSFYPTAFWLVVKHGFLTFGIITSLSVLWQRYMGSVEVPLLTGLIFIGVISGLVAGIVNYYTIKTCTLVK